MEVADRLSQAFDDNDQVAIKNITVEIARRLSSDGGSLSATWHPLGFLRLEFAADSAGQRYVFHHWPIDFRSTQEPAWMVHQHVWPFASRVLSGALIDSQFEAVDRPSTENGVRYLTVVQPTQSQLRTTHEPLHLRETKASRKCAGDAYDVQITRFHLTDVPLGEECLTLGRIGARMREFSQVLGPPDGPDEIFYERVPGSPSDVNALLQAVIGQG